MTDHQPDSSVLEKIRQLVNEEHQLHSAKDPDPGRLEALRVELDQCWDLLRQRRALREFGGDPEQARVRPASTVENYKQ